MLLSFHSVNPIDRICQPSSGETWGDTLREFHCHECLQEYCNLVDSPMKSYLCKHTKNFSWTYNNLVPKPRIFLEVKNI